MWCVHTVRVNLLSQRIREQALITESETEEDAYDPLVVTAPTVAPTVPPAAPVVCLRVAAASVSLPTICVHV